MLDQDAAIGGDLGATAPAVTSFGAATDGATFGRFVVLRGIGRGGMGMVVAAHDPELDRNVALKVLYPDSRARVLGSERLQREAQAMARLAHPNVVTVYEVGTTATHSFIVMELVEGQTLNTWLQTRRSDREVLAMLIGAGRGLEAAHRAGIVHRDFKPENVLIGTDGRPRVGDFGLATSRRIEEPGSTVCAQAIGTPAYMSPEQWKADAVDSRSDQFSFCVTAWRAMWRTPPFVAPDAAGLRREVVSGQITPLSNAGRRSRWLVPILTRGLALDPNDRWPSMTELLDALERRLVATRRTTIIAAAAAGLVSTVAVAAITSGIRNESPMCAPPNARIEAVWSRVRRAAVEMHLFAIDPARGADRFRAISRQLDQGAVGWGRMHIEACRATRSEGRQSDTLLDLRMTCLDEWMQRFDSTVEGLERAWNPEMLESAVKALTAVDRLSRCADTTLLQAEAPPPVDELLRVQAATVADEVRALHAMSAPIDAALEARAQAAVTRARSIGYAPVTLDALNARAQLSLRREDLETATRSLRELVEVAAIAHNDEQGSLGWAKLVHIAGYFEGHTSEANAMLPAARAASARAGNPPEVYAEVLTAAAEVQTAQGDLDGAVASLERARSELVRNGASEWGSQSAPQLGRVLHALAVAYATAEREAEAAPHAQRAIDIFDRSYGRDTIESAASHLILSQVLRNQGKLDEGERHARESIRIRESIAGESAALAEALIVLVDILVAANRLDEATAFSARAMAMARGTMPADARLCGVLASVGDLYAAMRRLDEALATYDEIIRIVEREHIENGNVAIWRMNRGENLRELGRCEEAIAEYRRAALISVQVTGKRAPLIGESLRQQGICLRQLHRDQAAIASLESSLGFDRVPFMEQGAAVADGVLGMLLVDTGADPVRGRSLASSAAARLDKVNSRDAVVAEFSRWRQRHHIP